MEVVILFLVLVLVVGAIAVLAAEPPSAQQRADAAKRQIERQKAQALDEIDAATVAHKRQVFEIVNQLNRQQVALQADEARRRAEEVVARATKEHE